jgi:hypothetical protein
MFEHTGVAFLAAAGVDPSENHASGGSSNVAFTYDRCRHLFPEVDVGVTATFETLHNFEQQTGTDRY